MISAMGDYRVLIRTVADSYGIAAEAITGTSRSTRSVFGRRIVAICLREMGYSYPEIGDALKRNHTSIMRLVKGQARAERDTARRFDAAHQEAKKIVAGYVPVKLPRSEMGVPRDSLEAAWQRAVEAYRNAMPHERDNVWIRECRIVFPHSWWAQASMPPRIGA